MAGRSRSYTPDVKDKAAQSLRSLPPKPPAERPLSTTEIIKQLKPEIAAAISNGYTLQEIMDHLKKSGVNVGLSTLKSGLRGTSKPRHKAQPSQS